MLRRNAFVAASKSLGWKGPKIDVPPLREVREAIDNGDVHALLRWNRFCRSPGSARIGKPDFSEVLEREAKVLVLVMEGLRRVRQAIEQAEDDADPVNSGLKAGQGENGS